MFVKCKQNSSVLSQIAETLIKKETLNYDDIEALIGPPPFGKKRLIDPADFEELVRKDAGDTLPQKNNKEENKASAKANN